MGYMLPLRFINVSRDPVVAICATRIATMMSTKVYQARRTIHDQKKAGTLINACGTKAAKTAIILDNGAVVSSPLSISVLMNAIEKSNIKASTKNIQRLKVYDVYDEDPSPEIDEDIKEMSTYDEDDDKTDIYEEEDEYDDDDSDDDEYGY